MKKHFNIVIAGAGGIAEAAGLILMEWSEVAPTLYIGNRTLSKAQKVAKWIEEGTTKPCTFKSFHLPENGITDEMLRKSGRTPAEVFPVLALMFEDLPVVGHNVSFDLGFLNHHLKALSLPVMLNQQFDTIALAKQYLPPLPTYRLENVARFLEIPQPSAHRALADVITTRQIYEALIKRAGIKK